MSTLGPQWREIERDDGIFVAVHQCGWENDDYEDVEELEHECLKPAYRDGLVHVMSERCSTCVFRPGNLMHLPAGRLKELVETNLANDTAFACHQTTYGADPRGEAICRGYFDAHQTDVTPLRFAVALEVVQFQTPKEKA